MSSFIVSDICMNNIIQGLFYNNKFKERNSELYDKQKIDSSKDFETLANKLWNMNKKAVIMRYCRDDDYSKVPEFKWNDNTKTPNNFQLLKSLHCLRYQCSEGSVPQDELYLWLEEVIKSLESYIVYGLPEYESATWDH